MPDPSLQDAIPHDAAALDAADPLAPLRDAFHLPEGVIYLDGNSLGPLSRKAAARLRETVEREWGDSLVRGWNAHGWAELPERLGDRIGRLIGAAPGATLVCDTTSVNLFKMLAAALELRPGREVILSDEENFPSDLYIADGLTRLIGRGRLRLVPRARLLDALDADVAVAMITQVDYRSGARLDLAATTRRVQAAGAAMLWDLAHSTGAFPVDIAASGAEFAVGCGYKYLNGGPGAPAFLYMRPDLIEGLRPALSGWFGHAAPFAFDPAYRPAPGIGRMRVGTPAILSMRALDAALDVFDAVDMTEIARKSQALSALFVAELERRAPPGEIALASPRDPAQRGSQVAFRCPHAHAVCQALIAEGVIGDFRAPDLIRFGFAPLYLRFVDVADAAFRLAEILHERRWDRPEHHLRAAVT